MKDVAKHAGVSLITVSRVVNANGYVRVSTRARVLAAIDTLGYIPNQVARNLNSRQTNTLALVLPTISDPFWHSIARGVEDEAESRGYNVLLCNTDDDATKEGRYIDAQLRSRVDGVVIIPTFESGPQLRRLQRQGMPFVQVHRRVAAIDSDFVGMDSYSGTRALACHLIAQGRTRIAYVGGANTSSTGVDRLSGYREALIDAGIAVDPALIKTGLYRARFGYETVRDLLAAPLRPDGLVVSNSTLALGALHALAEADVRMPHDIAVAAYYTLDHGEDYSPFAVTAVQQTYDMARLGTQCLFQRLEDPESPSQSVTIPNRIMVHPLFVCCPVAVDPETPDAFPSPVSLLA